MEKVVSLNDKHNMKDLLSDNIELVDRLSGKVKRTKITLTDHYTGEVLGEYENKVLITGSILAACRIFGIESDLDLPSYNDSMHFDNDNDQAEHDNVSIVQLFCVGDDGCGPTPKDVYVVNYNDRIEPLTDIHNVDIGCMYPFRYESVDDDLPDELREYYFGRKTFDNDMIGYFFKTFDTTPELHVRYTDGTQVDDNMYSSTTSQIAECYVETRLRITRNDFRDFFEKVIGWDNGRISTLSLCNAWYYEKDGKKYFQEIYPYTKLNFSVEWLVDLTKAIDFNYCVYY